MTSGKTFYDGVLFDINKAVKAALKDYSPNLNQAVGVVPGPSLPASGPSAPGDPPGSGYPPTAHNQDWSTITGTPTTLSGYGITDAQPLDSDLTAIAALATTSYGRGALTLADSAAALTYFDAAASGHDHGVAANGTWTWKAPAQSGDPGTNNAGVDNDSPSSATILYLNKFGPNSVDFSGVLSALRNGDVIYLQQANDATSWHRYEVTATPTTTGSAYAVPVSTLGGSAQGTEPANNAKVYIVINNGTISSGVLSTEDVQDIVGAFVAGGSGISSTYSDVGNTLTIGIADPLPVHGIRTAIGSNAAALFVPGQTSDTLPAIFAGSQTSGYGQAAVRGDSASGIGVFGLATTGTGVQAQATGGGLALNARRTSAGTANAIFAVSQIDVAPSGTAAAGFGGALRFRASSDTTATQDQAQVEAAWTDATHASRSAFLAFRTVNNAAALAERMRLTAPGALWLGKTSSGLTGSGDLDVAGNTRLDGTLTLPNKTANTVYAGPTTGSAATPDFRALVANDIPGIPTSKITSGQLSPAFGGTGVDNSSNSLTIPATGTAALRASSATAGRVGFWSSTTDISHDADLVWDNTNKRLGIGAASPGYIAELSKSDSTSTRTGAIGAEAAIVNTSTGGVRSAGLRFRAADTGSTIRSAARILGSFLAGTFPDSALILQTVSGSETFQDTMILRGLTVGITVAAPASRLDIGNGAITMAEMTAPGAPAANAVVLYAEDNGVGKTRLVARFNTGVVQVLALEP